MKTVWIVLALVGFMLVGATNSYVIHGRRGPRFAGRSQGRRAWLQWLAVCAVIVVVVVLVRAA